jgi:glycosyltransferase involved in cell wall biosynthesis
MGPIRFADGIGRSSIGLIDVLKNLFSIQYCRWGVCEFKDVSESIHNITTRKYRNPAKVLIFEAPLLDSHTSEFPLLPDADIRIAYSMFESTKIPQEWVVILNTLFDMVVVPDSFLVDVYKNCDVRIPIFVIPLGMDLDIWLDQSYLHSKAKNQPFTFGNLSSITPRKNQITLLNAFAKEFGNDPNVRLLLNGRTTESHYLQLLQKTISSLDLHNVTITNIALRKSDYVRVLKSLDCYVSPSLGEGFSLQPREALAIGLPSIVTDNTAQSTICLSKYVRSVPSQIPVNAIYTGWPDPMGLQFNCSIEDLATAMRDVYENYTSHAYTAFEARAWIKQYAYDNLQQLYKTLILPQKVLLSDRNEIKEGVLYTISPTLKQKYEKLQKEQTLLRKLSNNLIVALYQL